MTSRQWDWVLLAGVLCFLVGGAEVILGIPAQGALVVLGLILIGAGASGKRRARMR